MKMISRESWLESATVCDRGLVRRENQDNYFSDPSAGLFVVADGMGGGQGGAQASTLVAEAFKASISATDDLATRVEAVRHALDQANATIGAYARQAGYRQTGSTAAVLLLGDEMPGSALTVWVGDSRVYRVRDGKLAALTNDHTVANELFGRSKGAAGYSRTLPYAHVLTRALGVDPRVSPDARRCEAAPGDKFLVCSDGVHDMLLPEQITAILSAATTPQECLADLAKAIRTAGAVDNFTATVVFLKELAR